MMNEPPRLYKIFAQKNLFINRTWKKNNSIHYFGNTKKPHTMVDKRRSRKKRRTELSSSEESSSSESEFEQQPEEGQKHEEEDVFMTEEAMSNERAPSIDNLQLHSKSKITSTTADAIKTRLALHNIKQSSSEMEGYDTAASGTISPDEWLTMMLTEYGDNIDTLRTTAADFKGESIPILADLLRTSANVFAQ